MREYMRWPYGKCARVLVPSEDTRRLLIGAKGHADRIELWPRGVDTSLFSPDRRSRHLRDAWHVSENRPAILYVGRISREKGLHLLAPIQRRLHALGIEHRFIIAGDGPMLGALRRQMPDAIFTGVLGRQAIAESTQNRDTRALQLKLDELIRSTAGARPQLMQLEELDDDHLDTLKHEFERLRERRSRTTG